VLVVAVIGVAGYFAGNWAMKKYIGDEGSYMTLHINNWGDARKVLKLFKGETPAIAEADGATDANQTSAGDAMLAALGLTDGNYTIDKLVELLQEDDALHAPLKLSGGELAAVVQSLLAPGASENALSDVDLSTQCEAVTLVRTAEDGSAARITAVLSVSKAAVLEKVSGAGKWVLNLVLRGDKMYMSVGNIYTVEPGGLTAGTQATLTINNLNAEDSALFGDVLAGLMGGDSIAQTLSDALADTLNDISGGCTLDFIIEAEVHKLQITPVA
jgi:hypothetical protein